MSKLVLNVKYLLLLSFEFQIPPALAFRVLLANVIELG